MDKKIKEGLGDLAHAAEKDHEVQMARAELYKLAKYAIKLHDKLKGVSEAEGLEGWVQAKITKSADMIGSVYHHLDYQEVDDEPMMDLELPAKEMAESGLQAHIGNKKYGKDGMDKLRKAGRDGGGEEAKGKIKDKILGKKTNEASSCDCDCGKAICESCGKPHHKKKDKSYKESLQAKLEGKFKSAAQRKAVHAAKASGKK